MLIRLCFLLMFVMAGLPPAQAEPLPAAFITVIDLQGADRDAGTVIRRGTDELAARLLMPLQAGDEVFLRESGSRIVVTTEDGTDTEVSGAGARYRVPGDAAAGGGFWSMLGAVAEAVSGGEGEVAPDNMMTRETDDVINVPMAVRGANQVVDDGTPVWIAWRGGKAPYRLSIASGGAIEAHDGIRDTSFSFTLPKQSPRRQKIIIEDAGGRRVNVLIRLRDQQPRPPFDVSGKSPAAVLSHAAWLTSIDEGSWSLDAARLLSGQAGRNPAAALLLRRIAEGWRVEAAD